MLFNKNKCYAYNSMRAVYFNTVVKLQCTQTFSQSIILSQAVFKSFKLLLMLQSFETTIKATVCGREEQMSPNCNH